MNRQRGKFGDIGMGLAMAKFLEMQRYLNTAGIETFAMAGTLLGLIREGQLLSHDNDIDIGVMSEAALDRIEREIGPHYDLVERTGYDIPHGKTLWLWRHVGEPLAIPFEFQCHYTQKHLYFYNRKMDDTWKCYETHVEYPKMLLSSFKNILVLGEDVRVPDSPEAWLKAFYGDDWQTPKQYTDWRYNCPLFMSGWMTQMPLEN